MKSIEIYSFTSYPKNLAELVSLAVKFVHKYTHKMPPSVAKNLQLIFWMTAVDIVLLQLNQLSKTFSFLVMICIVFFSRI